MKLVGRLAGAALAAALAMGAPAAFAASDVAGSVHAPTDVANATRGTEHIAGLFDVYRNFLRSIADASRQRLVRSGRTAVHETAATAANRSRPAMPCQSRDIRMSDTPGSEVQPARA